jgi:hypothetical protein
MGAVLIVDDCVDRLARFLRTSDCRRCWLNPAAPVVIY